MVKFLGMTLVYCPGLKCILECWQYNSLVDLHAGGSGVRYHDGPDLKLFILVGWERSFRLLLGPPGLN